MELGKIIARNLNELRMERNLTLGQLSKISGISKAMLSDIEKGDSNPTINTIWKIANGLKVPYTPVRNFELFYVELDAHSSNATVGHSEKAQEYIYVIQGELVLHTEMGNYTLNSGDALVFDSSVKHTYINEQDALLTFMVINFYPN